MAEYTALAPLFTDIANAIRSKTGETGAITANSFPEKILNTNFLNPVWSNGGGWEFYDSRQAPVTAQNSYGNISKILAMGASSYDSTVNRFSICAILARNQKIYSTEYTIGSNIYRLYLHHSYSQLKSTVSFDCEVRYNGDQTWYSNYSSKMIIILPLS